MVFDSPFLRRMFTGNRPTPQTWQTALRIIPGMEPLALSDSAAEMVNTARDLWSRTPVTGDLVREHVPYVQYPSSGVLRNLRWLQERFGPSTEERTVLRTPPAFTDRPPVEQGVMPGTFRSNRLFMQPEALRQTTYKVAGIPLFSTVKEAPRFQGDLSRAIGIMENAIRSGTSDPVHGPPLPDELKRARVRAESADDIVRRLQTGESPVWMDELKQQLVSSQGYDPGNPGTAYDLMRSVLERNGVPEQQGGLYEIMVSRAPTIAREYMIAGGVDGEPMLDATFLPDYFQLYVDLKRAPLNHPAAAAERQRIAQAMREQMALALQRAGDPKSIIGYVRGEIQQAAENPNDTRTEADIIWQTLLAPYYHGTGTLESVAQDRQQHLYRLYDVWRREASTGNPGEFLDWLIINGFNPDAPFLGIRV